ncbi:hypothetical protein WICPIJ_002076 [Wickerhamomyces pijperi]|uniref:Uncharacterized protein n=1 Tax=Wickerhamomyces pijperi TaxID=599730 RepID=A0A9P8TQ45_WICPI|nr:hypothetical protein WICPIJ_002076 [Wickerhamomyces pijperi]
MFVGCHLTGSFDDFCGCLDAVVAVVAVTMILFSVDSPIGKSSAITGSSELNFDELCELIGWEAIVCDSPLSSKLTSVAEEDDEIETTDLLFRALRLRFEFEFEFVRLCCLYPFSDDFIGSRTCVGNDELLKVSWIDP